MSSRGNHQKLQRDKSVTGSGSSYNNLNNLNKGEENLAKHEYFPFSASTQSENFSNDWHMLFGLGLLLGLVLAIGFGFARGYVDQQITLILTGVVSTQVLLVLLGWNWQEANQYLNLG